MDTKSSDITLVDLLAAFSLATDLGLGQPMSHLLRSWQIAVRLAERLRAPIDRPALFYVAMLAWVGCVADAPEVAANFGDDIAFRADSYDVDLGGVAALAFFVSHAGAGGSLGQRARSIAALLASGGNRVAQGIQGHCLITSILAEDLGLGTDIATALRQFFARWDGKGVPRGLGGTDIALVVRIFHLADVVEVYDRRAGIPGAVGEARRRRGRQFDPEIVDAFCASADDILRDVPDVYDGSGRIVAEPELTVPLSNGELDHALTAFADFTDLRCPTRAGHSRRVSELAVAAAGQMRLTTEEITTLGRASLVHDIGLHGVPATILMKETALSASERERLRASSYYTERVLARPPALARIGAIAALAHERMDGTGHHRGLQGSALPLPGACELIDVPEIETLLARLGPDPLRPDADPALAFARITRSRTSVAALLMDQKVIAGIGNVYRAEILFRHHIDPFLPGRLLREQTWHELWPDLVALMKAGVRAGRIVTVRPEDRPRKRGPLNRREAVYVYRHAGEPCRVCGTEVRTQQLVARNLFWCPSCQPPGSG